MVIKSKLLKSLCPILAMSFLLACVYLGLGKENVNVDQFLWYQRTEDFFSALSQGKYANTYQQYHPGVLLMYLIRAGQVTYGLVTHTNSDFSTIPYYNFALYNFYTKFYVTTFPIILLGISAFVLYKLTGKKFISLLFLIFLLSEPYYIGLLRNLHLDALVSALIFTSVITFYAGIKLKSLKYVIISAIVSGLGLLTKSVCVSAAAMNLLLAVYYFFVDKKSRVWILGMFGLSVVLSALIFIALFPAMWVSPLETLNKIIHEGVISTGITGGDNFLHYVRGISVEDPGPSFYLLILKYRFGLLSQIIFMTFIGLIMYKILKKKKLGEVLPYFLFVYMLGYFVVFTFLGKKTDRYIAPIFPFMSLLCVLTFMRLKEQLNTSKFKIGVSVLASLLLMSNFVTLVLIHPYYFAYYNPFWGGIREAKNEIYINQGGVGAYEIALYLNSHEVKTNDLIGATNLKEIRPFLKYPITTLDESRRKLYRYVVLTIQRDRVFKNGRDLVKSIKVLGTTYIEVYYKSNLSN